MNAVVSVERLDGRSFMVRADRGGWLTNMFAGMLRAPGRPRADRVFQRGMMTASFVEMTRSGRDVLAVQFDFERQLDDPRMLFLRWDGETYLPRLGQPRLPNKTEIPRMVAYLRRTNGG